MARWIAALLALIVAAGGVYYFWQVRPQQEALAALTAKVGHLDLEVALLAVLQGPAAALQAQLTELESMRDALRRSAGDLEAQLAERDRQLSTLQARTSDLEAMRDQLERASDVLKREVAARERELADLRATQQELVDGLKQEIAARQIQVERVQDRLRVELVEEVLFDSGEAAIKPAGLDVLKRVGVILKKAENRNIDVEGHTDNVPIGAELAARFPTNWELSTARATNVARFLQDAVKIDPKLLSATGHSEYRPRAPNTSAEGRRKNRRIEILLGPVLEPVKPAAR
jgi:chemotaxis protein MotB